MHYTAMIVSAEKATAVELMRKYEKAYFEITGQKRFLFNRKNPENTRWFNVFVSLATEMAARHVEPDTYIKFCLTGAKAKTQPNFLLTKFGEFKDYLRSSKVNRVQNDPVDYRSLLGRIQAAMRSAVSLLNERASFFDNYEALLVSIYPMLPPEYLASDAVFLKMLNENKVQNADKLPLVGRCLYDWQTNPGLFEQVKAARDDALREFAAG